MSATLKITNTPIINANPGDRLDEVLIETVKFCRKYQCECVVEFNDQKHTVNRWTHADAAYREWFNY